MERYPILVIIFGPSGLYLPPNADKLFGFQSFDYERTWWRLFQQSVVRTKLDSYVYIGLPSSNTNQIQDWAEIKYYFIIFLIHLHFKW
jgi:hypothetical protein